MKYKPDIVFGGRKAKRLLWQKGRAGKKACYGLIYKQAKKLAKSLLGAELKENDNLDTLVKLYPEDSILVRKAKAGDKHAFVSLFDRYKERIAEYLYGFVGDYERAQDLTVEAFLSAYSRLKIYKERGKFSRWIYLIASELAREKFRAEVSPKGFLPNRTAEGKKAMSLADLAANDKTAPDYAARAGELKRLVFLAMSRLKEKDKATLLLCDVEGLPHDEAAKILGCKPSAVPAKLKEGRKKLHAVLQEYGYAF